MTAPRRSEPVTDPRIKPRIGFPEIIGTVMALVGVAGLMWEMYGRGGGEMHRTHLWVNVGLLTVGMYFVTPRRTGELVALIGAYIPRRGGDRPADVLATRDSVPVEVVRTSEHAETPAAVEQAKQEISGPQTATAAAAHTFDPGA